MEKREGMIDRPGPAQLLLWRSMTRPVLEKGRKGLIASLAILLLVLLTLAWAGLTHQLHSASARVTSTAPLALSQIEPPRRGSSLVYDPLRHVVLLFGGTLLTAGGTLTNETWTWNGQSWQQLHPATSPPALQGTLVYDAASQQIILFLDQVLSGGNVANEMWTWNGITWHQLQTALVPEVLGAGLAYDAGRGQVLLFGGESPGTGGQNGTLTNATWIWNGSSWQQLHPATSPSPRTAAALAYDSTHQQIMLYGGITLAGLSSETWTWNGSSWQQAQTGHLLSPRQNALLVYDSATQQMLLFGGLNAAGTQPAQSDTWVWQNNGWVRVSATGAPTDLYESVVYDGATRTVVVYAAQGSISKLEPSNAPAPVSQTWLWNGTTWKLLSSHP